MIWFTSDTHFGHENVLKFTDRPWETIWQMNDAIVDSINGRVWAMDRGTSTDTSTAAAARTTSSTASRAFCATTSVAMPTGTPR